MLGFVCLSAWSALEESQMCRLISANGEGCRWPGSSLSWLLSHHYDLYYSSVPGRELRPRRAISCHSRTQLSRSSGLSASSNHRTFPAVSLRQITVWASVSSAVNGSVVERREAVQSDEVLSEFPTSVKSQTTTVCRPKPFISCPPTLSSYRGSSNLAKLFEKGKSAWPLISSEVIGALSGCGPARRDQTTRRPPCCSLALSAPLLRADTHSWPL